MSADRDPARKRRIRSKAARLRRRPARGAAAVDRPAPPTRARPPAAPVPPAEETGGGGAVAAVPASPVRGAAGPPPLPVRGATPAPVNAVDGTPDSPAVPPPFLPLSTLSAEELLADRPSLDMLRRVRRGLRALPESDGHLSD